MHGALCSFHPPTHAQNKAEDCARGRIGLLNITALFLSVPRPSSHLHPPLLEGATSVGLEHARQALYHTAAAAAAFLILLLSCSFAADLTINTIGLSAHLANIS